MPDTPMEIIAPKTAQIDVNYLGYPQVIASCLLEGDGGVALVDPGPTSALHTLRAKLAERGLKIADIDVLLLTHIHLDHAGATGTLVRENPRLRVFVHERGARHMIEPAKLLESATRLYGGEMDRLFGEFLPVPAENVHALAGGERIHAGGRALDVVYTPGHASHHVTYFDTATGIAFVGDTAGIRIANQGYVLPVTPPPDIDLEVWGNSLEQIRARHPARLFVTHFGVADGVDEHVEELKEGLRTWAESVRGSLAEGSGDDERASKFAHAVAEELGRSFGEREVGTYVRAATPKLCWFGLARYWRKRGVGQAAG